MWSFGRKMETPEIATISMTKAAEYAKICCKRHQIVLLFNVCLLYQLGIIFCVAKSYIARLEQQAIGHTTIFFPFTIYTPF